MIVIKDTEMNNKKLIIYMDRTSVCLGDDMEDHKQIMKIKQNCSVIELSKFIKIKYLPKIGGGNATWVLEYNKEKIAVIAQQFDNPLLLINNKRVKELVANEDKTPTFFLDYKAQEDPYITLEKIK